MTPAFKRKWARATLEKARARLFLDEWHIDLVLAKKDKEMQNGGRPAAECWADPVYMQATITLYPCFWNSHLARREHIIKHELNHCHTQRIWDMAHGFLNGQFCTPEEIRKEIESLTQRITNIAFPEGMK
jgi:hypothetical protein